MIYCKLEIACKSHTNISNSLWFKDPIPKGLMPGVVYKFQCGLCNEFYYGKSIRYLDIRSGEHIGVWAFTVKKAKATSDSVFPDHLLHCKYLSSFHNFSILVQENKTFLLKIKESLQIMRYKPSL